MNNRTPVTNPEQTLEHALHYIWGQYGGTLAAFLIARALWACRESRITAELAQGNTGLRYQPIIARNL